jgi:DNA-binding CsgD family transcriptional regulator/PAS domain-containing protein
MAVANSARDEALHSIYAAALEPHLWGDALRRLADLLQADRGMLFTVLHRADQGGFRHLFGLSESLIAIWDAYHFNDDPTLVEAHRQGYVVEGKAVHLGAVMPIDSLRRTAYYRDVWQVADVDDFCAGVVFGSSDSRTMPAALSLYRAKDRKRFGASDSRQLESLLPHVSRAIGVMVHLRDRDRALAATLAALNRLPAAVMLVDRAGRIVFHNEAAGRLTSGDPLRLVGSVAGDQLSLPSRLSAFEGVLRRAIASSLDPLCSEVEHFSEAIVLPAADGTPSCVLHVSSLDPDSYYGTRECAVVIGYDLAMAAQVPAQRLVEAFGLTPGEARAALQILAGGTAATMAARLGVAESTFKTQLHEAYQKTHTYKQPTLLKLLLALATP